MTAIYRWNGEYFGFLRGGYLFDASARCLGWITYNGYLWQNSGEFIGTLTHQNYILRRITAASVNRGTRPAPKVTVRPIKRNNRRGKPPRPGWVNGLDSFPSSSSMQPASE